MSERQDSKRQRVRQSLLGSWSLYYVCIGSKHFGGWGSYVSTLSGGSNKGLGGSGGGLTKTTTGLIPVWDTPEWTVADDQNNRGYRLIHEGQFEDGLALLSQSARYGLPWALSSFTWRCLQSGEYERGIREYEASIEACERIVPQLVVNPGFAVTAPEQLANARSNTALLKVANGGSLEEARATWEAGAATGHTESQFYPALVAQKMGNPHEADTLVRALPPAVWFDARQILQEGCEEGGWFKDWCLAGLEILERNPPTASLTELPDIDISMVKDLPYASNEESKDGIWEAVRLAVDLDPDGEVALREFAEGGDATSWIARNELGCLLTTPEYSNSNDQEGKEFLYLCMSAPYRDIVASAAWNRAEVAKYEGDLEVAAKLAAVAVELGEGTALRATAERLLADGREDDAVELYERAAAELPRGDMNRATARAYLTSRQVVGIPESLSSWFLDQQGALSPGDWNDLAHLALWAGEFNVDVARAAIATRYFEECPAECYYEPVPYECADCGRGMRNFVHAASGKGDGGYNVFTLLGPVPSGEIDTVGLFIPFLGEDVDGLNFVGRGAQFLDIIGSAAPLVLGTLSCDGHLIVNDSSKSRDDRDVSACIEMPADEYVVVCWLKPDDDPAAALAAGMFGGTRTGDPLVSVALMAVRGPLADLIVDCCSSDLEKADRDALLEELWGNEMRTVNTLMTDIRPQILTNMLEHNPSEELRNSFLLQAAERESGGEDAVFALQNVGEVGSFSTLNALAERGFVEPELRWWTTSSANDPSDIWSRVMQLRGDEPLETGDSTSENVWVRRALARRTDLPTAAGEVLKNDQDDRVRRNLASNPSTGTTLLAELAEDTDPAVVSAVASNPNTSVDTLRTLAQRGSGPKGALANNPNTPADALAQVVTGGTSAVRQAIAGRPDVPAGLANELVEDKLSVRRALASNHASPSEVLAKLSKDESDWVRMRVAGNTSTSPETLTELSLDSDEDVREAVMGNPSAPEMAKAQAALLGAKPAHEEETGSSGSQTVVDTAISVRTRAKFCPECGTPLEEQHKFCVGCGMAAPEPLVTIADVGPWAVLQADWEIRGNFNVESGAAGFGTRIFEWCDCEGYTASGQFCGACGRGPGNYVAVNSGSGDGVYPIFRLLDAQGNQQGAVALFEGGWAVGIEDKTRRPADLISSATPVYAGSLTIDGPMYASEATAGWDCDYALVDVELPPGEYEVIAWQAEMEILKEREMEPYTRQIALAVYSRDLVEALELVTPVDRRKASREAMASRNCGLIQVLSHKEPRWSDACMYNASEDADRGEEDRSSSWLLQAAKFGHLAAANSLPPNYLESMAPLDVARRARLLLMRGQRTAEAPPKSHAPTPGTSESTQSTNSGLTKQSSGLGGDGLTKESPGLGGKGL